MSLNTTSIIKQGKGLLFPECSGENKPWLHFPSCCFSFPASFTSDDIEANIRANVARADVPVLHRVICVFGAIALVISSKCARKCQVHCIIQLMSLL